MNDCIFCKIIDKKIPADFVFENESFVVFKDIKPKAPLHFLIVPKKHIVSVNEIEKEDKEVLGEIFFVAKDVAKNMGVDKNGYKLSVNIGEGGGQEVPHLHLHLLGGWKINN
jgi:histidine triad (HIT) family protein